MRTRSLENDQLPISESRALKANFNPSLHVLHLLALRPIEALETNFMVYLACTCQLRRIPHVEDDALRLLENTTKKSECVSKCTSAVDTDTHS